MLRSKVLNNIFWLKAARYLSLISLPLQEHWVFLVVMLGKTYRKVSDRNPRSRTRNHNRSNSRTLAEAAELSAAAASEASSCPRVCCEVAEFYF